MKKIVFTAVTAAGLLLSACNGASDSTTANGVDIDNFRVSQNIMTAARSYRLIDRENADTCHLTLETTVQWPEEIAGKDIRPLQYKILELAFASPDGTRAADAIAGFITSPYEWEDSTMYPLCDTVATVPQDGMQNHQVDVTVRINELTTRSVTYFVQSSSYLGGAHPGSAMTPFTYLLDSKNVVTLDNLFVAGSRKALAEVVNAALAAQFGVAPRHLSDVGFFSNTVEPSEMVYIADNMIVFHYNEYEIAPYAVGMIDVTVNPYEVSSLLTPAMREWFGVDDMNF